MWCMGPFNRREVEDDGLALAINDTSPDFAPIAATHTAPMRESIEPRATEVKKEALMETINWIGVNDLRSKSWAGRGERPVGVPAAHGHWGDGGADIRGALESPEHDSVCRWGVRTSIGRSAQLRPVRKYSKGGSWEFRSAC